MEEKEPIKVKLSTAIFLIIILILIAVIVYFVLQNNILQNQKQLDEAETKNSTLTTETEKVANTAPSREKVVDELVKSLTDENWIESNIRIKENGNQKISNNDIQTYTFSVLNSDTELPTVIVKVDSEKNNLMRAFAVQYNNNKVEATSFTDEPVHNEHNSYFASDKYFAEMYAHMGSWQYTLNEVNNNKISKAKTDKGTLKEGESDYTELENIEKKYDLKSITTTLNSQNLNKALKSTTSNTSSNSKTTDKYKEITKNLDSDEKMIITSVEKNNNEYILKGEIYREYTLTNEEFKDIIKKGKIKILGKEYKVTKHDGGYYIDGAENGVGYQIIKDNSGKYTIIRNAQVSEVWTSTGKYGKIIVDANTKVESFEASREFEAKNRNKTTVKKFFKDFGSDSTKDSKTNSTVDDIGIHITGYKFEFKDGKCVKINFYNNAI